MPFTEYIIGNSHSLDRTFSQALQFEDPSGNILDASVGFADEQVVLSKNYDLLIQSVPGRALSHIHSGTQQTPIEFSFRVPVWTLDGAQFENSVVQIENFFANANGGLIKIYWIKDDEDGYYAYLPSCLLKSISAVRNSNKRVREVSYVEMTVQSLSKGWVKTFPADSAPLAILARGPWLHTASTNDGSVALAVIRESDKQALMELDDQGYLRTLGPIKDNQDLSTWDDLDLDEL